MGSVLAFAFALLVGCGLGTRDVASLADQLDRAAAEDHAAREAMKGVRPGTPEHAALVEKLQRIDRQNLRLIRNALDAHPARVLVEAGAGESLFVLVQHADSDRALQEEVLAEIRPLAGEGAIRRDFVALLEDRVAVAQDKPQEFGTQGLCSGDEWEPYAIAEVDGLTRRRAAFDLPPFDQYRQIMNRMCRGQR